MFSLTRHAGKTTLGYFGKTHNIKRKSNRKDRREREREKSKINTRGRIKDNERRSWGQSTGINREISQLDLEKLVNEPEEG